MAQAAEQVRETKQHLIPVESVNAIEIFTGDGLTELLERIEQEARSLVSDVSTPAGRQEIKSTAYSVTRSKTTIDKAGKELVADWKKKASAVDAGRRQAREFLDGLAKDIRQPLTEWEEEQARIEAEQKLKAEVDAAHEEALELDALWDQAKELERREAEIARKEAEAAAREQAERIDAERRAEAERREKEAREREERAAREAEERAKREGEQSLVRSDHAAQLQVIQAELQPADSEPGRACHRDGCGRAS